jgi:single-stranded DNA-binding protein
MSVAILINGSIFREPQQRTSQSGKRYVVTTIKAAAADNSTSDFWSVLAFGDTAGAELLRLAIGERVTIQGGLKLETYEKNGETKISRTIFADHVLALRAPPKERRAKAAKAPASQDHAEQSSESSRSAAASSTAAAPFDDDIPFAPEFR